MPAPLPLPTRDAPGCNADMVARAISKSNDPLHRLTEAAATAADTVSNIGETIYYEVQSLLANAAGTAVQEGRYYIRCLQGQKYLDVDGPCAGQDGCKAQLWSLGQSPSNNVFRISKTVGGYRIENGNKFLEVKAEELLANGGRIQVWGRIPGAVHQVWLFYRVDGNRYVIKNAATGKVLDAVDACTGNNGCQVQQWNPRNSDPTQVWILERIGN